MTFKTFRCLTVLLTLVLFLNVYEAPNAAQEIVPGLTRSHLLETNPVYVLAPPSEDKIPARPINLPIVSLRKPPPAAVGDATVGVPFAMNAAQAVKIGKALLTDGDFQTALPYFQEARTQQPLSFDALAGLAECYYELQRDDEALATYKEVVAQNGNVWKVQFNLGRIHLEHGRFAESTEAFTHALKIKPDDPDTMAGLGLALIKQGRTAEGIPYLTRVAALKRYVPEDFYALGEAYANEKEWLKAAEAFKNGAEIRGLSPDAYSNWATMLYNADKFDEAIEVYLKVKKLAVDHLESSYYLADIFRRLGKPTVALGYYRQILRQKPDDTDVLARAAFLYLKLDQLGEAERHYGKLGTLDRTNPAATNLAAIQSRDNEKLIKFHLPTPGITLREVVAANPNHGEAHINLGGQLVTEGVYPEAVTVLQRAVLLLPDSAAAHFNLAIALLKIREYEAALASSRRALQLKPGWAEAYNTMGLAYAGLNKWAEATQAYLEAIRIIPDYASATYSLGAAYLKVGKIELATQLLEKLKTMSWDLKAKLAEEIQAASPAVVAATPTPAPDPSPPVAVVSPAEDVCPGPIYRSSDVTRRAAISEDLQAAYTDEALKNNAKGTLILQAVVCSNGRVSDISVEQGLPYGLTERAIESLKKAQFQPALIDSKPVSVMIKQEFACAQSFCTSVAHR